MIGRNRKRRFRREINPRSRIVRNDAGHYDGRAIVALFVRRSAGLCWGSKKIERGLYAENGSLRGSGHRVLHGFLAERKRESPEHPVWGEASPRGE